MTAESTNPGDAVLDIDLRESSVSLTNVWIDPDDSTLSFQVEGEIRGVDPDTMDRLNGKRLEPVSIRVQLHDSGN